MKKLWTVCYYTFRESLARKTFIGFFIISSIVLFILLLAVNVDVVNGALASLSLFGKQAKGINVKIEEFVFGVEFTLATLLFTGGLFMSIFATASLIPNMLEKGNIDWILARPISRTQLLAGRYLGAIGIVAFNVFYLILGAWLIISIKTGFWLVEFLTAGVLILVVFAVLYGFMALLGVLLQNSALSIMGAYLMIFFSPMLFQRNRVYALLSSEVYRKILDGLYYLTAPIFEVGEVMRHLMQHKTAVNFMPVWHSLILALFYFTLAVVFFRRKDF